MTLALVSLLWMSKSVSAPIDAPSPISIRASEEFIDKIESSRMYVFHSLLGFAKNKLQKKHLYTNIGTYFYIK